MYNAFVQEAQLSQIDRAMLRVIECLTNKSLKVSQNRTIIKLGYGFLFVFHSNCGFISYRFRNKARYLVENRNFSTPCIRRPR